MGTQIFISSILRSGSSAIPTHQNLSYIECSDVAGLGKCHELKIMEFLSWVTAVSSIIRHRAYRHERYEEAEGEGAERGHKP